jgi:hypothetical protein
MRTWIRQFVQNEALVHSRVNAECASTTQYTELASIKDDSFISGIFRGPTIPSETQPFIPVMSAFVWGILVEEIKAACNHIFVHTLCLALLYYLRSGDREIGRSGESAIKIDYIPRLCDLSKAPVVHRVPLCIPKRLEMFFKISGHCRGWCLVPFEHLFRNFRAVGL